MRLTERRVPRGSASRRDWDCRHGPMRHGRRHRAGRHQVCPPQPRAGRSHARPTRRRHRCFRCGGRPEPSRSRPRPCRAARGDAGGASGARVRARQGVEPRARAHALPARTKAERGRRPPRARPRRRGAADPRGGARRLRRPGRGREARGAPVAVAAAWPWTEFLRSTAATSLGGDAAPPPTARRPPSRPRSAPPKPTSPRSAAPPGPTST